MMLTYIRHSVAIIAISCISVFSQAQSVGTGIAENKPYKILTSGKQITVKSTRNIKNILVWTASGHRIVEQREVNASTYSFNINVSEKIFFLMIEYEGSKPFTEKIGI